LRSLFAAAVLLVATAVPAAAQEAAPDFEVDVVTVRGDRADSRARIDMYTRIAYDNLSFLNSSTGFTADYEVKVDAFRLSDEGRIRNLVQSKIWDATLQTDTYADTQAKESYDFTTQSLELESGHYFFEFEIADKNSNQVYTREIPVDVRSFDGPVAISDITLLDSYDADDFTIVPRVDGAVATDEGGFQIFYEIYADDETNAVVRKEVFRIRDDGSYPTRIAGGSDAADGGNAAYEDEEPVTIPSGRSQYIVTVPVEDLKVGTYMVRVAVNDSTGSTFDSAELSFAAEWSGLAQHIEKIDDAIAQLQYIAKKRDLNFIKDAPNEVERYRRFRSFWEKRDPTPGTKRNERMEEYYYRISAANRQYGAVQDGWKTDRGFVLVRFGEPDYVQRKPHSFNYEPYEIWVYERIGRQFVFIDKTGFGDYELMVPIWDERTRLY
jgi:GWxTD domain-containing protein